MPELARAADAYQSALDHFQTTPTPTSAAAARSAFDRLLAIALSSGASATIAARCISDVRAVIRDELRATGAAVTEHLAAVDHELTNGDFSALDGHLDAAIGFLVDRRETLAAHLRELHVCEERLLETIRGS